MILNNIIFYYFIIKKTIKKELGFPQKKAHVEDIIFMRLTPNPLISSRFYHDP